MKYRRFVQQVVGDTRSSLPMGKDISPYNYLSDYEYLFEYLYSSLNCETTTKEKYDLKTVSRGSCGMLHTR